MLRVTKERLIISCPCDSLSNAFEIHLSNMLKSMYGVIPDWLSEHLKNGLPNVKDILGNLKELGREFSIIGNEGIMQHYGEILLDMQFAESKGLYELHSSKSVFAPPIGESEWDRYSNLEVSRFFRRHMDNKTPPAISPEGFCQSSRHITSWEQDVSPRRSQGDISYCRA
jgi:hypothetical protein